MPTPTDSHVKYQIQIKRGLLADLPAVARDGEPLVTTDTRQFFVGTGTGIEEIVPGGSVSQSYVDAGDAATLAAAEAYTDGHSPTGVEFQANKSTDGTFAANSDTLYPSQKAARTYVNAQVAALVNSSPAALDTLKELADALGDDPNFAATVTTALAGKASATASVTINTSKGLTGGGNVVLGSALSLSANEPVTAKTGDYSFVDADSGGLFAWNDAADRVVTFPAASGSSFANGWEVTVKNLSSTNKLTITPTGVTIDGRSTLDIPPRTIARIVGDGTNYRTGLTASAAVLPANVIMASDPTTANGMLRARAMVGADLPNPINVPVSMGNAAVALSNPPPSGTPQGWIQIKNTETRIGATYEGQSSFFNAIPTGDSSSSTYIGSGFTAEIDASNTHILNALQCAAFGSHNYGSGAIGNQYGIDVGCFNLGSSTVTEAIGAEIDCLNVSTGNITTNLGALVFTGNNGSGVVSTDISLQVNTPAHVGLVSHHYGIYIQDQTVGGANNPDPWAIYVVAGKVFVGSTVDATGFKISGAAASGKVLRGNGTNFVSATLAVADLSDGVTGTGTIVLAASPALTGNPTVPTQSSSDNSTRAANTAYVTTAVAGALTAGGAELLVHKDAASGYAGLDADIQLASAEFPAWLVEGVNNSMVNGPVDGSNNPDNVHVATVSTVATATVQSGIEAYIDGQYNKTVNTNLTVVLNNGTDGTHPLANFIYLKKRTSSKSLTTGDVGVTTNPFVFGNDRTAPSTALATSSNPVYWFDPTVNLWKKATSNGGAFSADPILPLAVAGVDSSGNLLAIGYWPRRWTPWKVMEVCGQGTSGRLLVQSGTSTVDLPHKQYTSLTVLAGTLQSNVASSGLGFLCAFSQSPILICGALNQNGKGAGGAGAGTGAGAAGSLGAWGGAGGGGGSSATTAGGASGNIFTPGIPANNINRAGAGGTVGNAGGAGTASNILPFMFSSPFGANGSGGGAGGGDGGAASGGGGGTGGGGCFLRAPSITVSNTGSITANGTNGSNGGGTNGGAGGGGGGGLISLYAGYYSNSGTVTASAGTGGTHAGTGKDGGTGGAGTVQVQTIF